MNLWKKLFKSSVQKSRRPIGDPAHFKKLHTEFQLVIGEISKAAVGMIELSLEDAHRVARKALVIADKMIEMEPQRGIPWTCRCLALGALHQFADALEANKQALEIDPSDPDKWDLRASILKSLGKFNAAGEAQREAAKLRGMLSNPVDREA